MPSISPHSQSIIALFKRMGVLYAKKYNALKRQVDYLESHIYDDRPQNMLPGFPMSVVFDHPAEFK